MGGKTKKGEMEPGRMKLPPSGLAEDILGLQHDLPAEQAHAGEANAPHGEERIYTFADGLEKVEGYAEAAESLETWVTFGLAEEAFAFPVTHVQEILKVEIITRVPHAPKPVRGVTNMRGRVLPVVDLRVRLGLPEAPISEESKILVVGSRGRLLGLLVDSVHQVLRLNMDDLQPPPPDVMTDQSDYILGVYHLADSLVILLDVDKILLIKEAGSK